MNLEVETCGRSSHARNIHADCPPIEVLDIQYRHVTIFSHDNALDRLGSLHDSMLYFRKGKICIAMCFAHRRDIISPKKKSHTQQSHSDNLFNHSTFSAHLQVGRETSQSRARAHEDTEVHTLAPCRDQQAPELPARISSQFFS